ncbi:hypothetical protein PN499_19550 [Kamptonema animale CS-326]|jgi:DNA-directed RNA polymerase specialized sigma24 family protein|uniref:hypothetical protein n=1 Tax=Kamptonema animale TaxID=92934 RepID=UPI002330F3A9|nr:hypothetical protein [Kamptonema animale]MDB9513393.1 hypothetical protein [Kamptonema animale CS-326]
MSFDQEQNRLQDEGLMMLAIEAQRHPPKSKERRMALTKLVEKILKSGRLCRPCQGQFGDRYEEIYQEAIQKLMIYICEKIDQYKPEKSPVMRWVNFYMEKRFFNDAIREILGKSNVKVGSIPDENNLEQPEKIPLLSELILDYIENDPEQLCQNLRHKMYPHVNFQSLAMRILAGEKWREISADLGIPLSTLSSFYQRSLRELSQKIKLYLNN